MDSPFSFSIKLQLICSLSPKFSNRCRLKRRGLVYYSSEKLSMFSVDKAWTSLVVQWLRLGTSNAGDIASVSGQATEIPHALLKTKSKTTKTKS